MKYPLVSVIGMLAAMAVVINQARAAEIPTLPPSLRAPEELGVDGFAMSGEVPIHFVSLGTGPLMVLIHGFPDFWYTWRRQMPVLAAHHQVVAIDQRGYNFSGQPVGMTNYTVEKLVGDVVAVIRHFHQTNAVVVGHDWGGMVAWSMAMTHPEMTERLVILNLPHPNGLIRELAHNSEQQKNSAYARYFQTAEAASQLKPEALVGWMKDESAKAPYLEAVRRSSMEGMLNYYKANYPREPYTVPTTDSPKVLCPVLMFHGLKDQALLPGALNDTWKWIDNELTLITVPGADHWVQQDASELVTRNMVDWLKRTSK